MSKPDDKILDLSMFKKHVGEEQEIREKISEQEMPEETEQSQQFEGSQENTEEIEEGLEETFEESGKPVEFEGEPEKFDEESEDFAEESGELDGEPEEFEEESEEFDEESEDFAEDFEQEKEAEILDFGLAKAGRSTKQADKFDSEESEWEESNEEEHGKAKSEFKEKLGAILGGIALAVLVAAIFAIALIARDKLAEKDKKSGGTPVATENDADKNENSPYAWWFNRDVTEGVSVATDADAQSSTDKLEKGKRVLFGTYNQGPGGEVDKISWIVLDVQEDYVLLTTEYVLDMMPYSKSGVVQWADSDVRSWLNNGFFNQAFSSKEKESVLSLTVENNDNPLYNTESGANTDDRVFLLSFEEMNKHFGNIEKQCVATPFALEKSGTTGSQRSVTYWLRSPGSTDIIGIEPGNGAVVDSDGNVSYEGNAVTYTVIGIRPVIRIRL